MKIKNIIAVLVVLFASMSQGMNAVEFLEEQFGTVSVTSTNLGIQFKSSRYIIIPYKKRVVIYRSSEFMDKFLILTADQERLSITNNEGMAVYFTAVAFKNQVNGFRVSHLTHGLSHIIKTNIMYLALSDMPLNVSEEDYLEDIPVKEKTSAELDVIMRGQYKARSAARKAKRDQAQAQASNETSSASSPVPFSAPIFAETNSPITQAPDAATPEQIAQGETARDAATQNETGASGARHWLWLFAFPAAACILFLFANTLDYALLCAHK